MMVSRNIEKHLDIISFSGTDTKCAANSDVWILKVTLKVCIKYFEFDWMDSSTIVNHDHL